MLSNVVLDVQRLFLDEAKQSPLLFSDLASVEGYISESYSGRSLIELLQNADDAGASTFYVEPLDTHAFLVANNGHPFTNNDFLALCRSGASTKKRKSNTIGFRGIGFKAVVNYAKTVHLISGDIKATFSRQKTLALLPAAEKVPLIRVPHPFDGIRFQDAINRILENGYNTVFVFETDKQALQSEIDELSGSGLLFVNHICRVLINGESNKTISLTRKTLSNDLMDIEITESVGNKRWIVAKSKSESRREAVAFRCDGQKVVDAESDEAVFHSFMPTKDKLSARIKVNGDFSTDPSRTRIVWDEESEKALYSAVEIIADLCRTIFEKERDSIGFVNVLKAISMDPLWQVKGMTPNDRFTKSVIEVLREVISQGDQKTAVYIQPESYDSDDFEMITQYLGVRGIGEKAQKNIPGIVELSKTLGFKPLPFEQSLEAMDTIDCSDRTRASVLVDTIKGTTFGMSSKQKELIRKSKIVKSTQGKKRIAEMDSKDKLDEAFEGMVTDHLPNLAEYKSFLKRIGIEQQSTTGEQVAQFVHFLGERTEASTTVQSFGTSRTIHKWRTVEKNVAALLELMPDVETVNDVSKQNVGYDLEVVLKNGKKRYYEVKSVDSLGDVFTFTNNEYSTAVENKREYYFAIACQLENSIEVCFIANPIETLRFEKRAVRWEWACSQYSGEVVKAKLM